MSERLEHWDIQRASRDSPRPSHRSNIFQMIQMSNRCWIHVSERASSAMLPVSAYLTGICPLFLSLVKPHLLAINDIEP